MRDILDVIDSLQSISTKEDFKSELERVKGSYWYTAPELRYLLWNRVHDAMITEYLDTDAYPTDEAFAILSEFTTKSESELREDFK